MTVFRRDGDDLLLDVRLTPRSAADKIDGVKHLGDGRAVLAARVRAVPEDGKANKALEQLVAAWFGLAKTSVAVNNGHTSRLKTLRLAMISVSDEQRLHALVGE